MTVIFVSLHLFLLQSPFYFRLLPYQEVGSMRMALRGQHTVFGLR